MNLGVRAALVAAALALVPAAAASGATGGTGTHDGPPRLGPPLVGPALVLDPGGDSYGLSVSPRVLLAGTTTTVHVTAWAQRYSPHVVADLAGARMAPELEAVEPGEGIEYAWEGDPRLPSEPACGLQHLSVTFEGAETGDDDVIRWEPVYVLCPELTLTPPELRSTDLPTEIVWEASGFVPSGTVALRLDDEPVEVVRTDRDGNARFAGPVDGLACGPVTATATDQITPELRKRYDIPQDAPIAASATLTVRCPEPVEPVDPVEPVPSVVQLNPVVVAAGTTTRVAGSLFPADDEVTLAWVFADGTTLPAGTARTNGDGAFVATVLVLVNEQQGPRELVAGTESGAAASDSALVVAGTTQPGRNGLVNRR